MPADAHPPIPPTEFPPARTVTVHGRGEFFMRDTGGDGPVVMLLHGWMVSADLNWHGAYDELAGAGYRVLGIDHRGHGRGLRPLVPFRLVDCAADAAAVLRELDVAPALVVGYSMGGAIAQLIGRDHPDVVRGLVLSGTAHHWQNPRTQRELKAIGLVGLLLALAPRTAWRLGFRRAGLRDTERTAWLQSEMMRGAPRDLVEAGREIGRFDSRPWLASLTVPVAHVITTHDEVVPPQRQRELAQAAGGPVFETPISHLEVTTRRSEYNPTLLNALSALGGTDAAQPPDRDQHSLPSARL
jgi:pimeloyl-ACP methyl ester carboxylesterase